MKIFSIILAILFGANIFAQSVPDSSTVIYAWRLENNYSSPVAFSLDTNLTNFQIYNPIYKYSISNSYLSNLGSPTVSNLFFERANDNDIFFLNAYLPYLNMSENTSFYNTKKPYSYLYYTVGGGSQNKEEAFDVFFTQNIAKKLNFGFRYDLISSKGQYRYLSVKKNSFRIITSYTGNQYVAHAAFNLNHLRNDESGGIIDSVFEKNSYSGSTMKEIPTVFNGNGSPYYTSYAKNRIRYYDLLLSQRLKLFTISSKTDSLKIDSVKSFAEPILTYVFKINRASKTYMHDPNAPGYYDIIYYNPYNTYDSVTNFKITNTIQLEFKTVIRNKVQAGVYGLLGYDYETYNLYSEGIDSLNGTYDTTRFTPDTLITLNNSAIRENTYIEAGIYGNFWRKVITRFSGVLYYAGEKIGQTELRGQLDSKFSLFKTNYEFSLKGVFENKYPDYLLENYYSNNYMFNKSLNQENWFRLSSNIAAPSNNFELSGNYYLIRSYIYFDTNAQPENYDQELNYFSIEVAKTFKLWKFCSTNDLVYQFSENQGILPLPDFVFHNSSYIDYNFRFKSTNGELRTMLGIDIYYNTSFKGYKYSPALAQFYIQEKQENGMIGDYPLIDAFLNIKLKRTRFFFKLQHFNSGWLGSNYYSAIHYPYNQFAFKFGISWAFYD
jgi:hypothetical protein